MCRDDTKLSHLASTGLFHPLIGTRHVTVFAVVWLFVFCVGCFLFVFVFCVVFCLLFFVFRFLLSERDKGFGLCIGPLPVTFAATTASAPA